MVVAEVFVRLTDVRFSGAVVEGLLSRFVQRGSLPRPPNISLMEWVRHNRSEAQDTADSHLRLLDRSNCGGY